MKSFFLVLLLIVTYCESIGLSFEKSRKEISSMMHACKTSSYLLGDWKNQLGSTMVINAVNEDPANVYNNSFTGYYTSTVGEVFGSYPLQGTYNYRKCSTSVGFNVIYSNNLVDSGSNTVWAGQLRCFNQTIVLETTWIMNKYTSDALKWESTLTGHDTFYRKDGARCYFEGDILKPIAQKTSSFKETVEKARRELKRIGSIVLY